MPDREDWPQCIIQSLPDSIITGDERFQVTNLNRSGEELWGIFRQQALGKHGGAGRDNQDNLLRSGELQEYQAF